MRIFLGFFGLTRSLRHTIGSIRTHVFDPLQQAGITAPRFGHFHLPPQISNARSGEYGLPTDASEADLLDLQTRCIENQTADLIVDMLAIARRYPDNYGDQYASVSNLCFQLRSLNRLWDMLEPALHAQDWVVFLRPDLLYLDRLDLPNIVAAMLRDGADLALPGWQSWGGLNDRFAVANMRGARTYATRMRQIAAATEASGTLHAERLLSYTASTNELRVLRLKERALRIRANGQAANNDLICFGLRRQMPADNASALVAPSRRNIRREKTSSLAWHMAGF